jgi:hypothetical protein
MEAPPTASRVIPRDVLARINKGYRTERSASGNRPDELKSGLQKYARRGETAKAMRCAVELYCFRLVGGKSVYTNLLHRLMIVYLEDVGPASYELWPLLDTLLVELRVEDTNGGLLEDGRARVALGYWVSTICRSRHSRCLSHYSSVYAIGCNVQQELLKSVGGLEGVCKEAGVPDRGVDMDLAGKVVSFSGRCARLSGKEGYPRFTDEDRGAVQAINSMLTLLDLASDGAFYWLYSVLMVKSVGRHLGSTKPGFLVLDALGWYAVESGVCTDYNVRHRREELAELLGIARRWYRELINLRESTLCLSMVLKWLLMAMTPPTDGGGQEMAASQLDDEEEVQIIGREEVGAFEVAGTPLPLDDYVLDMHTSKGRSLGRGRATFADEGSVVANEDTRVTYELYRRFYNLLKHQQDATAGVSKHPRRTVTRVVHLPVEPATPLVPPASTHTAMPTATHTATSGESRAVRESDIFIFDVRAQATCTDSRPDTYFALERASGRRVFVKGPYRNAEEAGVSARVAKLKRLCMPELALIEVGLRLLVPDLFPDVPLGTRRHVDRTRPQWFVVSDNAIPPVPPDHWLVGDGKATATCGMPVTDHATKVWGTVRVVDWSVLGSSIWPVACPRVPDPLRLAGAEVLEYVLNLLFRYVVGIPDPADRNFLLTRQGRIYSVDEEGLLRDTDYWKALKRRRCEVVCTYLRERWETVRDTLAAWLARVRTNHEEVGRILATPGSVLYIINKLEGISTQVGAVRVFSARQ